MQLGSASETGVCRYKYKNREEIRVQETDERIWIYPVEYLGSCYISNKIFQLLVGPITG